MGCHFLLQGIFPTQGSNLCPLYLQADSLPLSHQGRQGWTAAAAAAKSLQLCLTLCDPIDSSPPGSTVPGILQARTLEWVAISFSQCMKVKSESEVAQSCPTLSDPMDCSLPGSSVHGSFQARILEWGAIAFSRAGLGLGKRKAYTEVLGQDMVRDATGQFHRRRIKSKKWGELM